MKSLIYLLLSSLLFVSCTHLILRTGYQVKKSDYKPCEVIIKKGTQSEDATAIKVGAVLITDSGFSLICNEQDAMDILKREACALDADFILIKKEYEPSIISTCYRCSAEFYKFGIADSIQTNSKW
jgi:hypothetical protein